MPVRSTPDVGAFAGVAAGALAVGAGDWGWQAPQAQTTASSNADRRICMGRTGRKPAATIAAAGVGARCMKSSAEPTVPGNEKPALRRALGIEGWIPAFAGMTQ